MLTIGKLGASRGQLAYYEAQVAAGIEDYYAGRGEVAGMWCGSGAAAVGLAVGGRVEHVGFLALMQGRSPVDDTLLRRVGRSSTVAALDLTFSAPKSVSVLFAIADDHVSGALLEAHERAVAQALGYLEREACVTRRGHGGTESVAGEGFVAAGYRHRMSRAGDPQLHTHVLVANLTRADGRYTALDAHPLYEHKSAAGAAYRAVLRAEVRERLGWVSWRPVARGLFEIEGVPEAVLEHFSTRRAEIEQRALELTGVADGLSRERMEGIALATRRAKQYGVEGSTWREQARARAAEHGFGQAELAALQARPAADVEPVDLARLAVRLSGPEGLTANHNTFARRHALAEIASAYPEGASLGRLDQTTSGYLADSSVVAFGAPDGGVRRFTTVSLLACEEQIITGAALRATEATGIVDRRLVDGMLAGWAPALNAEQADAVRALTTSGRGMEAVQALAGTGKTTLLGAVAGVYEQAGWRVIGAAPTGRAARELRDTAAIPAATMHTLVGELDRTGGFAPHTVLLLDEAGMAPTRLTARLLAHAEPGKAKVIAVGDPGQLPSVQAGGWLAALARQQPSLTLRQVLRQHDPAERQALQALHDSHPAAYLEHKQPDLTVHDSEDAARSDVVAQWHDAQREHGLAGAVMIVRDNDTRERLNHAARQRLRHDGSLPGRSVMVGDREFAAGDRIIARRNDRHADIDNGTLATVLEIGDRAHRMIIQTDRGHQRELDLAYVHRHVEHAYALTGHGAQGATVEWAAVIGRPDEFTREWAYTALSRARQSTRLHVISQADAHDRERQQYAPEPADQAPAETVAALHRAMARSETEPLAIDHDHQALIRALGHHASIQLENTPIVGRLPPRSPSTRPAMARPGALGQPLHTNGRGLRIT